jgi:hypothetical protein
MPARASDLLLPREQRLTPVVRAFLERIYLPYFGNARRKGGPIVDLLRKETFDLEPYGRHQELIAALGKTHGRLIADERIFYRDHLAWGGPSDRTNGRQHRLAEILAQHRSDDFGFRDFREIKRAAIKKKDDELVDFLDRIEALEHLISPARIVFGYLLTQNGQTVESVVGKIAKEWRRPPHIDVDRLLSLQPEIAAAARSTTVAARWVQVADSFLRADYASLVNLLLEANAEVMQSRNGSAAWVSIESGRLRVRQPDEAEQLIPVSEAEDSWRSTYFINSLWNVARQLA